MDLCFVECAVLHYAYIHASILIKIKLLAFDRIPPSFGTPFFSRQDASILTKAIKNKKKKTMYFDTMDVSRRRLSGTLYYARSIYLHVRVPKVPASCATPRFLARRARRSPGYDGDACTLSRRLGNPTPANTGLACSLRERTFSRGRKRPELKLYYAKPDKTAAGRTLRIYLLFIVIIIINYFLFCSNN